MNHSPVAELITPPGGAVELGKESNPQTTLGSAYSPVDYMSITSFPRLPEDDGLSGENALKVRKDDDNALMEQDTDPDLFLKSARLQRLPSSASDLASHDISLQETHRDPFREECACQRDGLTVIITACLTFATGVTIALIMQIYLGNPQVFDQGAVVTDVSQCTSVGFSVLARQGSSVDAAISAALCLGVVHPHTSGIGGGGVMLVHNIRKNETKVIDFTETAPSGVTELMLTQTDLEQNVGLTVAVPGMLSGLQRAHELYGRLTWREVVTMAAEVARNGFNVTHELAAALAEVKDSEVSAAFEALFLPNGQRPLPGLLARRVDLASVLDAVAVKGISEFYSGNLTQEMVAAVQANGGVLTERDFGNYSAVLKQPAEALYQEHHVMTSPPPHAGSALITALNILEGYNISSQAPRNSTYHRIAEALKMALAFSTELGDPDFDPTMSEIVNRMQSKLHASLLRPMISDSEAFPVSHYTPLFSMEGVATAAAQVIVMGPDDLIVSFMSSLNKPFGSRIVTPSGILLNSQILDFSWPNKTQNSFPNPHNRPQPGKRPVSFLMPTVVRPAMGSCGTYVALGSSNGEKTLSGITQALINVLSSGQNMSSSLASGRLHPQLEPNTLLVDSEFLDEDVEQLRAKGHQVERTDVLSVVEGTRRTNDLIIGVKDPRSTDAAAISMSEREQD